MSDVNVGPTASSFVLGCALDVVVVEAGELVAATETADTAFLAVLGQRRHYTANRLFEVRTYRFLHIALCRAFPARAPQKVLLKHVQHCHSSYTQRLQTLVAIPCSRV